MRPADPEELDPLLQEVTAELRRPVPSAPDLAPRVLAELLRPRWRRALAWATRPRRVAISPLGAAALAAGIAGALFLARGGTTASPDVRPVQFVLRAPEARSVSLVGDFNDWDVAADPLHPTRGADGVWTVEIPLAPGRHEYAFVIDGERWMADPGAPAVMDDFGQPGSALTVTRS